MSTSTLPHAGQSATTEAGMRLLSGITGTHPAAGLPAHLGQWGKLNLRQPGPTILRELEASGLVGHGGAWFPVSTKWRSVVSGSRRRPVVVANGAEGEPLSRKDAFLLTRAPHLVLDGLSVAAHVLRAHQAIAYVPGSRLDGVNAAIMERHELGLDPVDIVAVEAPDRFLAGQESAVVNALSRRAAIPSFVDLRSIRERGVAGRPTLVQNVETLAHVALIARFGADWFRSVGTSRSPGTILLTVSGRWERPMILEGELGSPMRTVLALSRSDLDGFGGALLGGYGGGWVTMPTLYDLVLTEDSARQAGSSLGAGIASLLPRTVCPLSEMADVVRYMEGQGAGQCGPCVHGLASLADEMATLAFGSPRRGDHVERILALCTLVDGRGACRHPDGVARYVRSGLTVFAEEAKSHLRHGPCALTRTPDAITPNRRVSRYVEERHS